MPPEMSHDTTSTFPARREAVRRARGFLADQIRLDPLRLAEAQILVSELVSLVVERAGEADPIEVSIDSRERSFRVTVSYPSAEPPAPPPELGRAVIERLSRKWGSGWSEGRWTGWFEIRRPGAGSDLSGIPDDELLAGAPIDDSYREELARRYLPLASRLARRFGGKGVAGSDLEQVAVVALLHALERFDPERGVFEAFASRTIVGELKRHLRDRAWAVHVPRGLQERSFEVRRAVDDLVQILGRSPTPGDIADRLGMTEDDVVEAIAVGGAYRADSIEAADDSGLGIIDRLAELDEDLAAVEMRSELADAIASLPERERRILELRFVDELSQAEIGEIVGVSQMHVSRLLARSLARLREVLES